MALAEIESLVLGDIALNDGAPWTILRDPEFTFTPAKKKLAWADSAMSDGAAVAGGEDHYSNAEMTFRLLLSRQADEDTARAAVSRLLTLLQETTKTFGGVPLTWTPSNSTVPLTFYVIQAEFESFPMTPESGYFSKGPPADIHLYLRPFGFTGEQRALWSFSEPWDGGVMGAGFTMVWNPIKGGRWRANDVANLNFIGGRLSFGTTSERVLYLPWTTADSTVSMQFQTGLTLTGATTSIVLKRQDANNFLMAQASAGAGALRILTRTSGTDNTPLATTAVTLDPSTQYWLVAEIDGVDVTLGIYPDGADPQDDPTVPVMATINTTLTGTDATTFGVDGSGNTVKGNLGLRMVAGSVNDWVVNQYNARRMRLVRSSEPAIGLEIPNVQGHVPAEARLVAQEAQPIGKTWRYFEWGRESQEYRGQGWPYLLDSDALDDSFAGSKITLTFGAYDPGAGGTGDVILSSPLSRTKTVTICGTGSLAHIGLFKVRIRVLGSGGIRFQFKHRTGSGPFEENLLSDPIPDGLNWYDLDLGTFEVEHKANTQNWEGRIDGISPDQEGAQVAIDFIQIIPVEAYGKARAPLQPLDATTFAAFDHFSGSGPIAAALDGKSLGSGNIWDTSGHATDFTYNTINHRADRAAVQDGFSVTGNTTGGGTSPIISGIAPNTNDIAVGDIAFIPSLGSFASKVITVQSSTAITLNANIPAPNLTGTPVVIGSCSFGRYGVIQTAGGAPISFTDIQIQADLRVADAVNNIVDFTGRMRHGVFARWQNASNWVMAVLETKSLQSEDVEGGGGGGTRFDNRLRMRVLQRVAGGAVSQLATLDLNHRPDERLTLILTIDSTGVWTATWFPYGTKQPRRPQKAGQSAAMATSGALQSGQCGIYDAYSLSSPSMTRIHDNVIVFTAAQDAVCFPDRHLQIKSDATEREQAAPSTGVYGNTPRYQGKRLFLEPAGDQGRVNRLFMKWRETDVDEIGDLVVTDAAILEAFVAPRYLFPPGNDGVTS